MADKAEAHINVKLDKRVPSLGDRSTQVPIVQGFCDAGRYLTLFDVGTGGGCTHLDSRRGWERRMFGPVFDGFDKQRCVRVGGGGWHTRLRSLHPARAPLHRCPGPTRVWLAGRSTAT